MFYSHDILNVKSGRLAMIWLVATGNADTGKKFRKHFREVMAVNVPRSCDVIMKHIMTSKNIKVDNVQSHSLYLSAMLMFGAVKVHNKQVNFLYDEASEYYKAVQSHLIQFEVPLITLSSAAKKVTLDDNIVEGLRLDVSLDTSSKQLNPNIFNIRSSHCWVNQTGKVRDLLRTKMTPEKVHEIIESENLTELLKDWDDIKSVPLNFPNVVSHIDDITLREELQLDEFSRERQLNAVNPLIGQDEFGAPFTELPEQFFKGDLLESLGVPPPVLDIHDKTPAPPKTKKTVGRRIDFEKTDELQSVPIAVQHDIEPQSNIVEPHPAIIDPQPEIVEPVPHLVEPQPIQQDIQLHPEAPQEPVQMEQASVTLQPETTGDASDKQQYKDTLEARIREQETTPCPAPAPHFKEIPPRPKRSRSIAPAEPDRTIDTEEKRRRSRRSANSPLRLGALPTEEVPLHAGRRIIPANKRRGGAAERNRRAVGLIIDRQTYIPKDAFKARHNCSEDTLRQNDPRSDAMDVRDVILRGAVTNLFGGVMHHGYHHCGSHTPFRRNHEFVFNIPPRGAKCLENLITRHYVASHTRERYDHKRSVRRSLHREEPFEENQETFEEIRERETSRDGSAVLIPNLSGRVSKSSSLHTSGFGSMRHRMKTLSRRLLRVPPTETSIAARKIAHPPAEQATTEAQIPVSEPVENMDVENINQVDATVLHADDNVPLTDADVLQKKELNQYETAKDKDVQEIIAREDAPAGLSLPPFGHIVIASEGSPQLIRKNRQEFYEEGVTEVAVTAEVHHPPPRTRQLEGPPESGEKELRSPPAKRMRIQTEAVNPMEGVEEALLPLDITLEAPPPVGITLAAPLPPPTSLSQFMDELVEQPPSEQLHPTTAVIRTGDDLSFVHPSGAEAFVPLSVTPIGDGRLPEGTHVSQSTPYVETIETTREHVLKQVIKTVRNEWKRKQDAGIQDINVSPVTFKRVLGPNPRRSHVVAGFSSLLELHKAQKVFLVQEVNYGTIQIRRGSRSK